MADDTLREIENEMRELKPDMDISYLDYSENTGDSEIADRLWHIFKAQKNRWNELVEKRNELLK